MINTSSRDQSSRPPQLFCRTRLGGIANALRMRYKNYCMPSSGVSSPELRPPLGVAFFARAALSLSHPLGGPNFRGFGVRNSSSLSRLTCLSQSRFSPYQSLLLSTRLCSGSTHHRLKRTADIAIADGGGPVGRAYAHLTEARSFEIARVLNDAIAQDRNARAVVIPEERKRAKPTPVFLNRESAPSAAPLDTAQLWIYTKSHGV